MITFSVTEETVSGATCSSSVNDDPVQFTTLEKTEVKQLVS